jgi:hypothetical protein
MKNFNDIGNQTRNLLACGTVPQPTVLPHAPKAMVDWAYSWDGTKTQVLVANLIQKKGNTPGHSVHSFYSSFPFFCPDELKANHPALPG